MKKVHFGIMLFLCGVVGFLVFSLYLSANQCIYNSIDGTYGALLGNELLIPYLIFCVMGLIGLIICAYETYLRKK
jgi:hypothetical protein